MKKMFLAVCVILLAVAMVGTTSAQSKLALNIGANVMLPMGTFGDAQGVGFGGTVQGEYAFMPNLNGTVKLGYITWGGKDITTPIGTISGGSFHGLPILVGGKYYFMPAGQGLRFYGQAELGFFIASVTVPGRPATSFFGVTIPGTPETTVSETDFCFSPTVGIELPMGNGAFDAGVNYFMVSATGATASNIGARVGYKFAL